MSEIERLRELVDAGKEDRREIDRLVDENGELAKENERLRFEIGGWDGLVVDLESKVDRLRKENERLRGLLKDVVGDVVQASDWENLMEKIEKEVGDE